MYVLSGQEDSEGFQTKKKEEWPYFGTLKIGKEMNEC